MRMETVTRLVQRKMVNAINAEPDHGLAPMTFYVTTGQRMADWLGPRQELLAERLLERRPNLEMLDEESLEHLARCDGALLSQNCAAVASNSDRRYLFSNVIPTIVRAMEIQAVVFGMSMHRYEIEVSPDEVKNITEAEAYVNGLIADMGMDSIFSHATECMILMACDREVQHTYTAFIDRDEDGVVTEVHDWVVRDLEEGDFGFHDMAQKALRSV